MWYEFGLPVKTQLYTHVHKPDTIMKINITLHFDQIDTFILNIFFIAHFLRSILFWFLQKYNFLAQKIFFLLYYKGWKTVLFINSPYNLSNIYVFKYLTLSLSNITRDFTRVWVFFKSILASCKILENYDHNGNNFFIYFFW